MYGWNGIEDLYMDKTGEILPENLFFLLSGFGSFCYMKTEKSELKRMIALGDGRTKKMYEFLGLLSSVLTTGITLTAPLTRPLGKQNWRLTEIIPSS